MESGAVARFALGIDIGTTAVKAALLQLPATTRRTTLANEHAAIAAGADAAACAPACHAPACHASSSSSTSSSNSTSGVAAARDGTSCHSEPSNVGDRHAATSRAPLTSDDVCVVASASVDHNAYVDGAARASHGAANTSAATSSVQPGRREQSVPAILAALDQAIRALQLPRFGHGDTRALRVLAITGQMHGVLRWRGDDPTCCSTLITWEDRRCDEPIVAAADGTSPATREFGCDPVTNTSERSSLVPRSRACINVLAALNDGIDAANAAGAIAGPVFTGYGAASLAWLAHARASIPSERAAEYDCAGTIGAFVACTLAGRAAAPVLDPTDAASWGVFDMQCHSATAPATTAHGSTCKSGSFMTDVLLRADAGGYAMRMLPAVLPTGSMLGSITARGCALLRQHALADAVFGVRLVAQPDAPSLINSRFSNDAGTEEHALRVPVAVAMGDHAASVVAALHTLQSPRAAHAAADGKAGADGFAIFVNIGTSAQVAAVPTGVGLTMEALLADVQRGAVQLPPGCEVRPFVNTNPAAGGVKSGRGCAHGTPSREGRLPVMLVGAAVNGGNVLACICDTMHRWAHSLASVQSRTRVPENNAGGAVIASTQYVDDTFTPDRLPWDKARTYAWLEAAAAEAASDSRDTDAANRVRVQPMLHAERIPVRSNVSAAAALTATSAPGLAISGLTQETTASPGHLYFATARAVVRNVVGMLPPRVWAACTRVITTGGALHKSVTLRQCLHAVLPIAAGVPVVELPDGGAAYAGAVGAVLAACSTLADQP